MQGLCREWIRILLNPGTPAPVVCTVGGWLASRPSKSSSPPTSSPCDSALTRQVRAGCTVILNGAGQNKMEYVLDGLYGPPNRRASSCAGRVPRRPVLSACRRSLGCSSIYTCPAPNLFAYRHLNHAEEFRTAAMLGQTGGFRGQPS